MAVRFAARFLVFALILVPVATGSRAEDVSAPSAPDAPASPSLASPPATPAGRQASAPGGRGNASTPLAPVEQRRLPEDSRTKQSIALPGRTLAFTATAGSIRLFNEKGEPQADIAYTSYQLDGVSQRERPVTFFFNGGPGASSAYLQLGNAGPWRLSFEGDMPASSASPELKPNAETWLDFTDLVFIDPVGTGYSRFVASGGSPVRSN